LPLRQRNTRVMPALVSRVLDLTFLGEPAAKMLGTSIPPH
jgi:hypothetical protein